MAAPPTYVSADSHVAEIEASFEDIDPRYRDRRPRAVTRPRRGRRREDAAHRQAGVL